MAGHTDSDDASEIFWPGYVDAVTNLAINLLFVIAVMSIVVLAVTMALRKAPNAQTEPSPSKAEKQGVAEQSAAPAAIKKMQDQKEAAEKQVATLSVTVAQLQAQLEKVQKQSQSSSSQAAASKQAAASQSKGEDSRNKQDAADASPTSGASDVKKVEVVTASQKPSNDSVANTMRQMTSGVLVLFSKNSVALEEAEAQNLVKKMGEFAPLTKARWHIEVLVPKGFSEALRLGYYRVNAVRNVLLQSGVSPNAIEMKVVESDLPGADNSRVFVRPAK